jgi:integrase
MEEKPPRLFEAAAMKYLAEEAGKRDYEGKVRHLTWFGKTFAGRAIHTITRAEVMDSLPTTDQRPFKAGKPIAAATRNRYLATIRGMLNAAAKSWDWMDSSPMLKDSPEAKKRIRWISPDEARRLLDAIPTNWMRDTTEMAFNTGLRWSNIIGLEWNQVDLMRKRAWIHADQAKAKKPIGIPLNEAAIAVIRRQLGKHSRYVFAHSGTPRAKSDNAQWTRACRRANIENFRFHDTRHTWASWHVQNGTPLNVLMELGGWSNYEMVLRYAHLAPDHLAEHAKAVTFWAQERPEILVNPGLKTA